jgi:hypothetical protein
MISITPLHSEHIVHGERTAESESQDGCARIDSVKRAHQVGRNPRYKVWKSPEWHACVSPLGVVGVWHAARSMSCADVNLLHVHLATGKIPGEHDESVREG